MRGRPAARRQQVLSYVNREIAGSGRAPSYGMICEALGIGTRSEVSRIVARLRDEGHVARAGKARVRWVHPN